MYLVTNFLEIFQGSTASRLSIILEFFIYLFTYLQYAHTYVYLLFLQYCDLTEALMVGDLFLFLDEWCLFSVLPWKFPKK